MDRYRDEFLFPPFRQERMSSGERYSLRQDHGGAESFDSRRFGLYPIVGPNRQAFGSEARLRSGWDDENTHDPDAAARIMMDNWLLFGLEELNAGRPVFLECTRDALMSGFVALLPARSVILKILGSVQPEPDVLGACRLLEAAGYRFALDDFERAENTHAFLEVADFIQVDFRHPARRKRASMLRRLRLTGATLIAANIESEEHFQLAREEGFGLFQGYSLGERLSFVKKRDLLDPIHCGRILEALQDASAAPGELAQLIDLESGIQCRLLRRANWVTPPGVVINSTGDALQVVEAGDIQKLVTLAMTAASLEGARVRVQPGQTFLKRTGGSGIARGARFMPSLNVSAQEHLGNGSSGGRTV